MNTNKKYHYFYKIINITNNRFYYGIHSTDNIEDGYMGSGTKLKYAYKKYGMDSFYKEIIKFFPDRKSASEYEAEVVNEVLIKSADCYNIKIGGDDGKTINTVRCFDIYDGVQKRVPCEEYYNNKDRYMTELNGKICVLNLLTNTHEFINKETYDKSIHKHNASGKVLAKSKDNQFLMVSIDDNRLLNGELSLFWKGRKHKKETIIKQKETYLKTHHQQGTKNSQYGTCWITNNNENKKIKLTELNYYLENGWIRGRKIKK